ERNPLVAVAVALSRCFQGREGAALRVHEAHSLGVIGSLPAQKRRQEVAFPWFCAVVVEPDEGRGHVPFLLVASEPDRSPTRRDAARARATTALRQKSFPQPRRLKRAEPAGAGRLRA